MPATNHQSTKSKNLQNNTAYYFKQFIAFIAAEEWKFPFEEAAAEAFAFFFVGFQPSSSIMQFALYELALNPEIQEKAQREIRRVIIEHNEELTYEGIQEMKYLECIISGKLESTSNFMLQN